MFDFSEYLQLLVRAKSLPYQVFTTSTKFGYIVWFAVKKLLMLHFISL